MSKYGNVKTYQDGITFDSQAEAERYGELKLAERAGTIRNLRVHTRWELVPAFAHRLGKESAAYYVDDFDYWENDRLIVEDVKGGKATQTPLFRLKQKMFHYRYPELELRIVEVGR